VYQLGLVLKIASFRAYILDCLWSVSVTGVT